MQSSDIDNPYRAPAAELTPIPSAVDPASTRATLGSRVLTHYLRLVGGLQLLYGLLFGWIFIQVTSSAIGRGLNLAEYHDLLSIVMGPICGVLALASLFAGSGTLRLQWWARRWQVLYLATYLTFMILEFVDDWNIRGRPAGDTLGMVLVSVLLTLPYIPLVFLTNWPIKPSAMPSEPSSEA